MTLSIIVAMDDNNLIGNNNALPWHLPADLAYFKQTTTGHSILMGRKTYDSIGKPLPNRRNIILSSNKNLVIKGAEVIHHFQDLSQMIAEDEELFIIGGAQLYQETLAYVGRLYITQISGQFEGDAYFPTLDMLQWQLKQEVQHKPDVNNKFPYIFKVLEKLIPFSKNNTIYNK